MISCRHICILGRGKASLFRCQALFRPASFKHIISLCQQCCLFWNRGIKLLRWFVLLGREIQRCERRSWEWRSQDSIAVSILWSKSLMWGEHWQQNCPQESTSMSIWMVIDNILYMKAFHICSSWWGGNFWAYLDNLEVSDMACGLPLLWLYWKSVQEEVALPVRSFVLQKKEVGELIAAVPSIAWNWQKFVCNIDGHCDIFLFSRLKSSKLGSTKCLIAISAWLS